jgi:hypothetical protein
MDIGIAGADATGIGEFEMDSGAMRGQDTESDALNARRQVTGLGADLRSRFGSYAEALRSMMQQASARYSDGIHPGYAHLQVIDSGGSIAGFDIDRIDPDESGIYREIMPLDDAQVRVHDANGSTPGLQDEMYEDELDDEGNDEECEAFPSVGTGPVDALASAAAALRFAIRDCMASI